MCKKVSTTSTTSTAFQKRLVYAVFRVLEKSPKYLHTVYTVYIFKMASPRSPLPIHQLAEVRRNYTRSLYAAVAS